MNQDKLANFLRDVSNWRWDEFVLAENDGKYSTNESMVFGLIRACVLQKMDAIKLSLNRMDGKLKTPIRIEMPKVYYLFPNAKPPEALPEKTLDVASDPTPEALEGQVITPHVIDQPERDLPSMSLREALSDMADQPRQLPTGIINLALQTEQWIKKNAPQPREIPMVKSVVAAHLLVMAQNRDITALTEVFDQIDGKLVETLQVVGDDMYLTSYSETAPEGAYLNKDGVVEIEATQSQDLWAQKLNKGVV